MYLYTLYFEADPCFRERLFVLDRLLTKEKLEFLYKKRNPSVEGLFLEGVLVAEVHPRRLWNFWKLWNAPLKLWDFQVENEHFPVVLLGTANYYTAYHELCRRYGDFALEDVTGQLTFKTYPLNGFGRKL